MHVFASCVCTSSYSKLGHPGTAKATLPDGTGMSHSSNILHLSINLQFVFCFGLCFLLNHQINSLSLDQEQRNHCHQHLGRSRTNIPSFTLQEINMLEKTKHTWFPTPKNTSKTYVTDSRNILPSCARGKVNRFYHSHKTLSLSLSLSLSLFYSPLSHKLTVFIFSVCCEIKCV